MFKVKWGVIVGVAGLALSFLISLIFAHTRLPIALLRALIFGVVFFALGGGISALINIFIPELLQSGTGGNAADNVFSAGAAGSRINITLEDEAPNAALPNTGDNAPSGEEVGNFSDLISGTINTMKDIDQSPATGYTDSEEAAEEEYAPAFESASLGEMGDFSLDFGAFVSEGGSADNADSDMDPFSFFPDTSGDSGSFEDAPPPESKYSRNKPAELKGDFDPKEIAAGLRTVLQKDKG